jgi:hypothetical protein
MDILPLTVFSDFCEAFDNFLRTLVVFAVLDLPLDFIIKLLEGALMI